MDWRKWLNDYSAGLAVLLTYTVASIIATTYQSYLRQSAQSHAKLTGLSALIASASPWVILAILAAVMLVGLSVVYKMQGAGERSVAQQSVPLEPIPSDAITVKQKELVENIEPIAAAYRAIIAMIVKLSVFATDIEERAPKDLMAPTAMTDLARHWGKSKARFDLDLKPDIIRLTTTLRSQHGLMDPDLNDDILSANIITPTVVWRMVEALNKLSGELSKRIAGMAEDL